MSKLLNVSSSPHVRCGVSTKNLMYDVAIAMLPATIWGCDAVRYPFPDRCSSNGSFLRTQ